MRARSGGGVSIGVQLPKKNSSARLGVPIKQMPVRKKFKPGVGPGLFLMGDQQDRGSGILGVLGVVGVDHFIVVCG
jgi:hypothetical protein